jgi:hypothetical protein
MNRRIARTAESSNHDRLLKLCDELGVEPEDLDDEIHQAKAEEASRINNGGLEDQIGFLRGSGFSYADLEKLIRTLATKKREAS